MTNSGRMRERIKIQLRSTIQDAAGEESPTWSTVAERNAEKLALPGNEIWSSKERSARVPTIFRMRFPKEFEVKPQMRVIHKSKIYDIISAVDEDGLGVDLLVSCDELVNEPINEPTQ